MQFVFTPMESTEDSYVIEVECPACHDKWERTRPKDVQASPRRYTIICPKCLTEGYLEL